MKSAWLVAKRELNAYSRSPLGYVVAAAALLIEGIYFYAIALGTGPHLSSKVLEVFFEGTAGTTMIVSVVLSMRLFSGEREQGTLVLYNTAPIREWEVVVGKFLAAALFLCLMTALTAYMPALIFVNGKVAIGHILVGYAGILLLGAASLGVSIFASAVANSQVVAAIIAAAILGAFFLLQFLAPVTEAPIRDVISALAIYNFRQRTFMQGVLKLENVFFNLGVAYFFLLGATKTLEARRWR